MGWGVWGLLILIASVYLSSGENNFSREGAKLSDRQENSLLPVKSYKALNNTVYFAVNFIDKIIFYCYCIATGTQFIGNDRITIL